LEALEARINLSPPTVVGVQIDNGTVQRSMIKSLTITFSEAVTFSGSPSNAFQLHRNSASFEQPNILGVVNLTAVETGSVVTITFNNSGPSPIFGVGGAGNLSLPNGRYTLTIDHTQVTGVDGNMASDFVLASAPAPAAPTNIFRLFGDVTGDGAVTISDYLGTGPNGNPPIIGLLQSFGGVNPYFDYNGNGIVDAFDVHQFFKSAASGPVP
jgi:hypothetical protein